MAQLFISGTVRYYGLPDSIVLDRVGQFVSEFWTEVCRVVRFKWKLSTAYHPQTDGQSEIATQPMTQRLCVLVNQRQDD